MSGTLTLSNSTATNEVPAVNEVRELTANELELIAGGVEDVLVSGGALLGHHFCIINPP